MTLLRRIITVGCMAVSFIANAGDEQFTTKAKCSVTQQTNTELQLIQGTWEGVMVGDEAHQKVTITIACDSLHFHRDTNFWFETVITLPAGKDPKQLHATIKGGPPSQADSIGKVVKAIFKIEDETLTLATMVDDAEEKGFDAVGTRYELRKVGTQGEHAEPPKQVLEALPGLSPLPR